MPVQVALNPLILCMRFISLIQDLAKINQIPFLDNKKISDIIILGHYMD